MPPNPSPNPSVNIVHMYGQGLSINAVACALNLPYSRVRRELEAAGVPIRSRADSYKLGAPHPTSKLSAAAKDLLTSELMLGCKQHRQLADEYGITRERVRQIAQATHAPCGREIQKRLATSRAEARTQELKERGEIRQQLRDVRYKRWQDLWEQGLPLREMATQLGLSPRSIGVRITELRHTHPGWFPYRRIPAALRNVPQP